MAVLRTEVPVGYKTTIVRTLVAAFRDAFTAQYPEADFASLNVTNEYPLTPIEYPAIVVRYNERTIPNAGVGHAEYFNDPDGNLRKWFHRRFEGELELEICTLSPLDRDVLSNAVVELLAFGTLDALLENFAIRVYGEPGVDVGVLGLLHQISLNTDVITAGGEANQIAPWHPEDTMVYTNSYSIDCHGGFYNSPRSTSPLRLIQNVPVGTYIDIAIPVDLDPGNQWSFVFDYDDADAVIGKAVISTREDTYDEATVIGVGVIESSEEYIPAAPWAQFDDDPDTGSLRLSVSCTLPNATSPGNHLFAIVAVRHQFSLNSDTTVTVPAGWTLLDSPNVNNSAGASIMMLYKLADADDDQTLTLNIVASGFWSNLELTSAGGIRAAMQYFEVSKLKIPNLTPTRIAKGSTATNFNSGYESGNPSGGGLVFTGTDRTDADTFMIAAAAVSDVNSAAVTTNGVDVFRADGWVMVNHSPTYGFGAFDADNISITSWINPTVADITDGNLRTYYGTGAYAGGNNEFPAAVWALFG